MTDQSEGPAPKYLKFSTDHFWPAGPKSGVEFLAGRIYRVKADQARHALAAEAAEPSDKEAFEAQG